MNGDIEMVGVFTSDVECAHAVQKLHHMPNRGFHTFAPFPSEHIGEAVDEVRGWGRSPVRRFVLAGGITGALTAFAITVGTSLEWNINTGGRPIVSMPPYIIIMFEMMILFGVLGAVSSFFLTSGLPAFESASGYHSRFGADRFALVVRVPENDAAKFEAMMLDAGAEEVLREAA